MQKFNTLGLIFDTAQLEKALKLILEELIEEHPLPWTIDQDWTWEVTASDGHIIAKISYDTFKEAKELIKLVNNIAEEKK